MNTMTRAIRRFGTSALRAPGRGLAVTALVGAIAVTGCQSGDSLAGPTWQWTAQQVTNAAGQPVDPDPESYTIEFRADGTVDVQADCNRLTGTYTVGVPLDLTINLATSQLPACGDQSLDGVYLDNLGRISSYSTDRGELRLFSADDAGAMQFSKGS
jgi:heat shock protein HslJ